MKEIKKKKKKKQTQIKFQKKNLKLNYLFFSVRIKSIISWISLSLFLSFFIMFNNDDDDETLNESFKNIVVFFLK